MGICGTGQTGVWRLINSDYSSLESVVMKQIGDLDQPFQPEWEKFIVTEIVKGMLQTLFNALNCSCCISIVLDSIHYLRAVSSGKFSRFSSTKYEVKGE